jgi:hypothetical protein
VIVRPRRGRAVAQERSELGLADAPDGVARLGDGRQRVGDVPEDELADAAPVAVDDRLEALGPDVEEVARPRATGRGDSPPGDRRTWGG